VVDYGYAFVGCGDLVHIVCSQFKVKDIKVFFNTLFAARLLKIQKKLPGYGGQLLMLIWCAFA
jgi:hypothetical protein